MNSSWLEPIIRLCESLETLPDVDPAVRIRIVPAREEAVVEATLPDGRVALRRVHSPDELERTVEALVLLPPGPPVPHAPDAPGLRSGASPARAVSPPRPENALGISIGAEVVGRASSGPLYASAGLAASAGIDVHDWLLALTMRYEPVEMLVAGAPSSFEMETVGAGFLFGRRVIHASFFRIDVAATANFLSETESVQQSDSEFAASATDIRLGVSTRALFGATWAFAPSIAAEISPARVTREIKIDADLPRLPSWSVALGFGAVWEVH